MKQSPATARVDSARPGGRYRSRPLRRKLLGAAIVLALLVLFVLDGARVVGSHLPFFVERGMAARYVPKLPAPDTYSRALSAFTEKIAAVQGLPSVIAVEVHVIHDDTVQAFATLGGHILLHDGLLRALRSEDELAALLAHQVAHLARRHPAQALGRRVSAGLVLSLVSKDWAEAVSRPWFHADLRTAPRFQEDHEAQTLEATAETLHTLYGHLGGVKDLAATLRRLATPTRQGVRTITDTHPGIAALDEAILAVSDAHGWRADDARGARRPLPAELSPSTTAATPAAGMPSPQ